ncbi:MAG: putative DNA binding domain-containing protein [candidate division Zixibacteria bacterium]|nr:putative DNA binding domain-containing protein [candidate division Zixibacteria bacterium]
MDSARGLFDSIKGRGFEAIKELVDDKVPENGILEYKTKAGDQPGKPSDIDFNNLAEDLSAFGNVDGGVIVWGVKCRSNKAGDIPTGLSPIEQLHGFKSRIENRLATLTTPPPVGVQNHLISTGTVDKGYLVTCIPKADTLPVRSLRTQQYYLRSGSACVIMPHTVLAAMFGRRPEPIIELVYKKSNINLHHQREVWVESIFEVKNSGVAVERDIHFTFIVESTPGGLCTVSPTPMGDRWDAKHEPDEVSIVSKDGICLPPMSSWPAFRLAIRVSQPIERGLQLSLYYGCMNSKPRTLTWYKPKEFFEQMVMELLPKNGELPLSPEEWASHRKEVGPKEVKYREAVFAIEKGASES